MPLRHSSSLALVICLVSSLSIQIEVCVPCHWHQVYQAALAHLLDISRLWRHGTPADADDLDVKVEAFINNLQVLCKRIDVCPLLAKTHELRHIARDLRFFGPANGTSSGLWPSSCTTPPLLHCSESVETLSYALDYCAVVHGPSDIRAHCC